MKSLLTTLSIFISLICYSQKSPYPTPYQKLGSIGIAVSDTGGFFVRETFVPPVYSDTAAANISRARLYAGSVIRTTTPDSFWRRNASASQWLSFGGSGIIFFRSPLYVDSATSTVYMKEVSSTDTGYLTPTLLDSLLNSGGFLPKAGIGNATGDIEGRLKSNTLRIVNDSLGGMYIDARNKFSSYYQKGGGDGYYIDGINDRLTIISNGGENLVIDSSGFKFGAGKVGIGITPNYLLHVNGSIAANLDSVPVTTGETYGLVQDGTTGQFKKQLLGGGSGAGWSLTGNAGTDSLVNFLGTIDIQPFIVKANNLEVMRAGISENIAIGTSSNASGYAATAIGNGALASGVSSTAIGNSPVAAGIASTSIGNSGQAIGDYSSVIGNHSTAIGEYSMAFGSENFASGTHSITVGIYNNAIGLESIVMGRNNIAKSNEGMVVGKFNDTTGQANNDTTLAFAVGIGFNNNSRRNALTILQNGNVGIGYTLPTYTLQVNGSIAANKDSIPITTGKTWGVVIDTTTGQFKRQVLSGGSTDTTSLSNRINTKLSATDTASLSNRINTKLASTDTISLSNRINLKADINSPTLVTPNIGVATGTSLNMGSGQIVLTSGTSVDYPMLLERSLVGTVSKHGFGDKTTIGFTSPSAAYASYDARTTINTSINHLANFQAMPTIGASGALGIHYGLISLPTITAGGTIGDYYGVKLAQSGAGISNFYGLYVDNSVITTNADSNIALFGGRGRVIIPAAVRAVPNYGTVSIGSAPFDGTTAGFFTGNASGTKIAINAASGFSGDLTQMQVAGVSRFTVSGTGSVGIGVATANMTSKLNIFNSTASAASSTRYGNGSIALTSGLDVGLTAANAGQLMYIGAATLNIGTNNTARMTIGGSSTVTFATGLRLPYVAKSASYTITTADNTIEVTATGQTITLPTAASVAGAIYTVKLTASGSCTVGTTSSQTIDGSTTYSLSAQYKYVKVMSNGSNWIIVANN